MSTFDKPSRFTSATVGVIAIVQLVLGVVFLGFPEQFPELLGLEHAPGWTDWMFAQFGARSLGFAYGMWLVLRDPRRHSSWIPAMIVVQVLDWVGTVLALVEGKVTLAQVTTAPFLPILFVVVLALELRRQAGAPATTPVTARPEAA